MSSRQTCLSFATVPRRGPGPNHQPPPIDVICQPPPNSDITTAHTSAPPSSSSSSTPQQQESSSPAPPARHQQPLNPARVYINHVLAELSRSISYKNTGKKKNTSSELQGQFPWDSMSHDPPHPIVENARKSPKSSALYLQRSDFYRKRVHVWAPELIFQSHFTHGAYGTKVPCPTCKENNREGGGFKEIKTKGWGTPIKVYGEHDVEYLVFKR